MSSRKITLLKKREDFVRVAKSGIKSVQKGLILQAAPIPSIKSPSSTSQNSFRIGFTATKKIGNAVIRNRSKRRLREVVSIIMCKNNIENFDFVVIARYNTKDLPFTTLLNSLEKALSDINNHLS